MPHIHVRGAHRQRDPRREDILRNGMNANESRDNKRPTETVEHDRRELGIEEREVGLRTHPGVIVDA